MKSLAAHPLPRQKRLWSGYPGHLVCRESMSPPGHCLFTMSTATRQRGARPRSIRLSDNHGVQCDLTILLISPVLTQIPRVRFLLSPSIPHFPHAALPVQPLPTEHGILTAKANKNSPLALVFYPPRQRLLPEYRRYASLRLRKP